MRQSRESHSHLPPGHEPGALLRDHPITEGALPGLMSPRLTDVTVSLPRTEYRRGETVEPIVVTTSGDRELLVGLVCTEWYLDVRQDGGPTLTGGPEWESWRPVAGESPAFVIPPAAPYSHEGTVLSLSWAVLVREPRRLRPDPTLRTPIWVSP